MEYWLIGKMLKEGLDVYVPLVDDFGIDAVIRKRDNSFIEVQIKARSNTVLEASAAQFAAIDHPTVRKNYYFVFYSERLDAMWVMSSEEFIKEAVQNQNGRGAGKRSIWFNGTKTDRNTNTRRAYRRPRYEQYLASNFARFAEVAGLVTEPSDG
jgi:hypothetical protein